MFIKEIVSGLLIIIVQNTMSFKNLLVFGTGIYIGHTYDLKPVIDFGEKFVIDKYNDATEYFDRKKVERKEERKKEISNESFLNSEHVKKYFSSEPIQEESKGLIYSLKSWFS